MLPCFLHTHNLPSIIHITDLPSKDETTHTLSNSPLISSHSYKTHIPKSSLSLVGVAPMPSPSLCKKFKPQRIGEPYAGLLGLLVLIVVIIFCLFDLDYREVAKGLRFDTSMWSQLSREDEVVKRVDFLGEEGDGCDLFHGDWVWDQLYPLYDSRDCRFLDDGFRCSQNGRRDLLYTKWRWQPKTCNLPRFDSKLMLEKLRNKRMVFVGDSIGRNQWESVLCMLSSAVDKANSSIYEVNGSPITKHKGYLVFRFKDFNCTIEYYRAPFLVLQSRPPAGSPENMKTTLKLDEMDWSCAKWKDADFLVFNTGHWWNHEKTIRGGCYFQQGENVKLGMRVEDAYHKAMDTVMQWIHSEVNTTKTQVFFRTFSPVHFRGGDWNTGGTCHMEKLPEMGSSLVPSHNWAQYKVAAEVLSSNLSQAIKLNILDITQMSSRRKDGHSSRYFLGPGKGPAPINRQDCSHWCLPGVPDSWNELLFAFILKHEASARSGKLSIGGADLAQE